MVHVKRWRAPWRSLSALAFIAFAAFARPAAACTLGVSAPTGGGPTAAAIQATGTLLCGSIAGGGSYLDVYLEKDGVTVAHLSTSLMNRKSAQLTVSAPCSLGNWRAYASGVVPGQGVTPTFAYSSVVPISCSPYFTVSPSASVLEGSTGAAFIQVTKNGTSSQALSVSYSTGGGTATAGVDYSLVSGILTFPAGGTSSQSVMIPILDDNTQEPVETFNLTLSNPSGGALLGQMGGGANSVISITDTDGPLNNSISISDVSLEGTTGSYNTQGVYQLLSSGQIGGAAPACTPSCGSLGNWITPQTNISSYQARAINNGCVSTSGVSLGFGTWYNMVASPQWGLNLSSVDPGTTSEACSMTIEISAVSNPGVILDSATVNFNLWTGP